MAMGLNGPENDDTSACRPQTAFERYVSQRKNGLAVAPQDFKPQASPPLNTVEVLHRGHSRRGSNSYSHSRPGSVLPASDGGRPGITASATSGGAFPVLPAFSSASSLHSSVRSSRALTSDSCAFDELASAAASLASAAQCLALVPTKDKGLRKSYKALAQAASDLAANAQLSQTGSSAGETPNGGTAGHHSPFAPSHSSDALAVHSRLNRHSNEGLEASSAHALSRTSPSRTGSRLSVTTTSQQPHQQHALPVSASGSRLSAAAGYSQLAAARAEATSGSPAAAGPLRSSAQTPILTSTASAVAAPHLQPNFSPSSPAVAAVAATPPSISPFSRLMTPPRAFPSLHDDAQRPATTSGSVGSKTGVSVPRFPSYNPLIHVRFSELPRPGGTGGTPGGQRGGGSHTADGRPMTSSNPITHTTSDMRPGTTASRPGSTMSHQYQHPTDGTMYHQQRGAGQQAGAVAEFVTFGRGTMRGVAQWLEQEVHVPATVGLNGEIRLTSPAGRGGSAGSQVLVVDHHHHQQAGGRPAGKQAAARNQWDKPLSHVINARYDAAVSRLKDRIASLGPTSVSDAFRTRDVALSGRLDPAEFRKTLLDLNIGLDRGDPVLDILTEVAVQHARSGNSRRHADGSGGSIDYADFVSLVSLDQLRPGGAPQHQQAHDYDAETVPSTVQFPYGTFADVDCNQSVMLTSMDAKLEDVKQVFRDADTDCDGAVDLEQFRSALQAISGKYRLMLSDEEVQAAFREADGDYQGRVKYEQMLAAPHAAGARSLPEFLKPKSLRCSTTAPPWCLGRGGRRGAADSRPVTASEATALLKRLGSRQ